jgi:hypothetical protein
VTAMKSGGCWACGKSTPEPPELASPRLPPGLPYLVQSPFMSYKHRGVKRYTLRQHPGFDIIPLMEYILYWNSNSDDIMTISFDDYMAKLPKRRQQAAAKRAAELIAEEATLRQLREARERSQEEVARKLHIQQAAVSKLERRTDMYLSTLRGYIEAMGGKLEFIARFPNRAVRISQFEALDPNGRSRG